MQKLALRIHPGTWWLLGGTLAVIAGSATHLATPLAICAIAIALILGFREQAPWARSLRFYLLLAAVVVIIRILFRILFSYTEPNSAIAVELPRFSLNLGFASFEFLGPVSISALSGALIDGMRLAAIILSVAVATTLANPRKLLKSAPGALFEIATSVSVAINLAPQLIESFQRVRKARELRGKSKRTGRLAGIVIPVLEDTLDRSLLLAASMDARGFGRRGNQSKRELLAARLLALLGLILNLVGIFFLLGGFGLPIALSLIVAGLITAAIGVRLTSKRKLRTNLIRQERTYIDYATFMLLAIALIANFAGWLA